MPVIVFSSPKGGCGKTTAATLLATELAQKGASVAVIDADPNRNVADWAKLPRAPECLTVISDVTEETIVDQIQAGSAKAAVFDRCFRAAGRGRVWTARTSAISTWRFAVPAPSPARWSSACARRRAERWRGWHDDRPRSR